MPRYEAENTEVAIAVGIVLIYEISTLRQVFMRQLFCVTQKKE